MARKAISNGLRFDVLSRDGFTCQYCGKSAPDVELEIDHVVPVARGGGNDKANLIVACDVCNSGKKAKLIQYDKNLPYWQYHEEMPAEQREFIQGIRLTLCNQIRTCHEPNYTYFAKWLHLCLCDIKSIEEIRVMASYSESIRHMGDMLREHFISLDVDIEGVLEREHTLFWPLCIVRHILKSKHGQINERHVLARVYKLRQECVPAEEIIEQAWCSSTLHEWLDAAEDRIRLALGMPSIAEESYEGEEGGDTDVDRNA